MIVEGVKLTKGIAVWTRATHYCVVEDRTCYIYRYVCRFSGNISSLHLVVSCEQMSA